MSPGAGCRVVEIDDPRGGEPYPALVMYPALAPERPHAFGPYTAEVAMDAPVAGDDLPLVAVSHGTGGWHLLHRALAAHLARNGFAVVAPQHPGDNRHDNALAGTARILADRPRHMTGAIDWAFADAALGPRLRPGRVAVVGHSLGGYTALALAGGRAAAFPHETPDGAPAPVTTAADDRVVALVLLAPATAWFAAGDALAGVGVPILMLTAEVDEATPAWHAEVVRNGVPEGGRVEHRVVAGAGHYSFLSPYPPAMISPGFAPSQDPPGFDRVRFHEQMNAEILGFLRCAA